MTPAPRVYTSCTGRPAACAAGLFRRPGGPDSGLRAKAGRFSAGRNWKIAPRFYGVRAGWKALWWSVGRSRSVLKLPGSALFQKAVGDAGSLGICPDDSVGGADCALTAAQQPSSKPVVKYGFSVLLPSSLPLLVVSGRG